MNIALVRYGAQRKIFPLTWLLPRKTRGFRMDGIKVKLHYAYKVRKYASTLSVA